MHDISNASYEDAARRAFREEVADVEPAYVLPTILRAARLREAWLITLVCTVGALIILSGLLLLWSREPAPPAPTPTSTRIWEA